MPRKSASVDALDDVDPMSGLGLRIRHARLVMGLTLRELSAQAGCSESMLSKIERSQATPSLATLHRLARALNSNVGELTTTGAYEPSAVARAGKRPVLEFPAGPKHRSGIRLERVVVPARGQLLQADIHIIEPRVQSDEQIIHAGEELGLVLEGELELTLDTTKHRLSTGDSFYFPSNTPHSYRNPGRTITRVLWVNTPPTF